MRPAGNTPAPLIIGTAGHVDHGKTALVRALTGVETDRLEQERVRGLSIELGFAPLVLPSGRRLSIVDVPGHERFIGTMVAGVSGIDGYVMVIAATEGVRAQTIEHARVLAALDVRHGLVVITKTDLADPAQAAAAAGELLPGVEVIACAPDPAARAVPILAALDGLADGVAGRAAAHGPVVLHIDRSFSVAGAGTVVTGTLWSGSIAPGDTLTLMPAGRSVRVRGVQVHGQAAERAGAGERVAVNLARVARDGVVRGDVLATAGALEVTHVVRVTATAPLSDGDVVHVHHGTRATPARVRVRPGGAVSLRCRRPLIVAAGDRLVIRDGARRRTLGGGLVLDGRRVPAAAPGAARAVSARPSREAPGLDPPALQLADRLRSAGIVPTPDRGLSGEERARLGVLTAHGLAVRLAGGHHAAPEAVAAVEQEIRDAVAAHGSLTLPQLRDRLGGSRNQAKAFLDYFDGVGITVRRPDDRRVLRRAARGR